MRTMLSKVQSPSMAKLYKIDEPSKPVLGFFSWILDESCRHGVGLYGAFEIVYG